MTIFQSNRNTARPTLDRLKSPNSSDQLFVLAYGTSRSFGVIRSHICGRLLKIYHLVERHEDHGSSVVGLRKKTAPVAQVTSLILFGEDPKIISLSTVFWNFECFVAHKGIIKIKKRTKRPLG